MVNRREMLSAMVLGGGMAAGLPLDAAARAQPGNGGLAYALDSPIDNVEIYARLTGRPNQQQTYTYARGSVFGIDPARHEVVAEYGRHLFDLESCQIKVSRLSAEGVLTERSRAWMLYRDIATGDYLSTFRNPYTNQNVEVPQFKGRVSGNTVAPQGMQYKASISMESTAFGKPYRLKWAFLGDLAVARREAFTRWQDPRSKVFRTEMTLDTWSFPIAELRSRSTSYIPNVPSWVSETQWMEFLGMDSHPGHMLWRTDSRLFDSAEALPQEFVAASRRLLGNDILADVGWDDGR